MEKKDKNVHYSESSILLQTPNPILSFNELSQSPVLMPVISSSDVHSSSSNQISRGNAMDSSSKFSTTASAPLSQLEQPLLFRKSSLNTTTTFPTGPLTYSSAPLAHSSGPVTHSTAPLTYSSAPLTYSSVPPNYSSIPPTYSSVLPNPSTAPPKPSSVPPNPSAPPNPSSALANPSAPPNLSSALANPSAPPNPSDPPTYSAAPLVYQTSSFTKSAPLDANLSSLQAVGHPQNTASSVCFTHTPEPVATEAFVDGSKMRKNNQHDNPSIYPPGFPGATYCDISRSYTEPEFFRTGSEPLSRLFPDGKQSSVPCSPSNYNQCDLASLIHLSPYWLFKDTVENKEVWYGFSEIDNELLENVFQKGSHNVVPTDGGRYDVFIDKRLKKSVYFDAKDLEVRRSTWFYHIGSSTRYNPFTEEVAATLEKNFMHCHTSNQWQRRFNVPGIGSFSFENRDVMFLFKDGIEIWPSLPDSKTSPIVVKRGLPDGFEILSSEHSNIDNLVFIVQGIGSFCDLRFRTVSQCVDGFRDIANKLIAVHFKKEVESGNVGRIEFLPVAWHSKLHTSDVGLDRRMQNITLPSIPKLRHFTNDTLLDILLYSTPTYCQSIIDTVAYELNEMYKMFLDRNPDFKGNVFVAGHSLGSLILFDILANQPNIEAKSSSQDSTCTFKDIQSLFKHLQLEDSFEIFSEKEMSVELLSKLSEEDLISRGISKDVAKKLLNYLHSKKDDSVISEFSSSSTASGNKVKTAVRGELVNQNDVVFPSGRPNNGMSLIDYPSLKFSPAGFFALGSPIAMFLSVRGFHRVSEDFAFPTCPAFFHIFHPYDPVAFRIEPLIDPTFKENPVLIPHHKGRKRLHREIQENIAKFASQIKQKVTETMVFAFPFLSFSNAEVTDEVDKILELKMSETDKSENRSTSKEDIKIGCLNGGRRIDYVLQEKPIEALNDYVFALTSHATYWDSEDTVLLILREIYAAQGIVISAHQTDPKTLADNNPTLIQANVDNPSLQSVSSYCLPQDVMNSQILSECPAIDRSNESAVVTVPPSNIMLPIVNNPASNASSSEAGNIGPPPLSGFVKRSLFLR